MADGILGMSSVERERAFVIRQIAERVIPRRVGAEWLCLRYCVKTPGPGIALRGARVTLHHFADGSMNVHCKTGILPWTAVNTLNVPSPLANEKTIGPRIDAIIAAGAGKPCAQAPISQGCGQTAG